MPTFNIDFRLDTPGFEISALRSSISMLERQLSDLIARRTEEVRRQVANLDPTSEDDRAQYHFAFQELEWEVEHTYPRVYRGGLLLLVWAAYESGVDEVAGFMQERMRARLGLSDIRGRTVLDRAVKYFPEILRFTLHASADSLARLREVEFVRNAFAHANGRLAQVSPRTRTVLEAMTVSGRLHESFGTVQPTKSFLEDSLSLVDAELTSLVERARNWDDERLSALRQETAPGSPTAAA